MKVTTCIRLSFLTLFIWSCSSSANAASNRVCETEPPISRIILSLCSDLTRQIGSEGNFFISPLSISAALAMIYVGTEGSTKDQMSNALYNYFRGDQCLKKKVSDEFLKLITILENENNEALTLMMTNGVFVQLGSLVSKDYITMLEKFYKANLLYVDFNQNNNQALKIMNDWISEQTNGLMPQLLKETLNPLTVMVLLNVIYFKGFWEVPFSENNTFVGNFHTKKGIVEVELMKGEASLNYYHHRPSNNHILEMYYFRSNVSMLLVLPESVDDTSPTFDLTSEMLCLLKWELQPQDIQVIMPKFKLDYKRELSRDMTNLGLGQLFSDRADLSGIGHDLHISLMVHRAIIEVDESGTEAVAVSAVGIDARRKPSDRVTLNFDHPFLFYIINKELGLVLFAGRVSNPSSVV